jgi:HK97 gp10 family phage protein
MFDTRQVDEFARRLAAASDTSMTEAEWKRETAQDIADEMNPPVRTGDLKSSINPTDDGVTMADYWRYVEYGTVHMAPQPFVRPAVARQTRPALDDLAGRVLRDLT